MSNAKPEKHLPYFDDSVIITGPYLNKKQNRRFVTITDKKTIKRTQKTYAKYLMEVHLGRVLTKEETVDHRDRDTLNDVIGNLQILSQSEHARLDHVRVKPIRVICAWCKGNFTMEARDIRDRHRQKNAGPFCSPQCRGKYGAYIAHGGKKFKVQPKVKSEYYYLDKPKNNK